MRIKSDLRYELKYLIGREQMNALLPELLEYLTYDTHSGEDGGYPITSLYYDSPDYKAYWDKLEGHRNRRKVRVRVYGNEQVQPETPAFVEVKERVNVRIRKRRIKLPYEQANKFSEFVTFPGLSSEEEMIAQEVYYLYQTLQMRPACIVQYDRVALEGRDHFADLRVTFDTSVGGRVHDLSLLSTGHTSNQLLLPPEYVILEVKANQSVPLWMANLISRHQCTHRRISKYCTVLEHSKVIRSRQRIITSMRSPSLDLA